MNRFLAELVGTFALVFAGCGAAVADQIYGQALGTVGIGLVFGLIVMAMIYAIGNISGAHINPAVSLAFVVAGRFRLKEAFPYILAQCLGAIAAAALLWVLYPESTTLGATLPQEPIWRSLLMEVTLSFLLMLVILNVSTGHYEKGIMAGVAIGGFVAVAAMIGGPMSGASMNPARSLGPALLSGHWGSQWIYLIGPIGGAILAAPFCRWIQGPECCSSDLNAEEIRG